MEEADPARSLFQRIDTGELGRITRDDYREFLSSIDEALVSEDLVEQPFRLMPTHDGAILYQDFCNNYDKLLGIYNEPDVKGLDRRYSIVAANDNEPASLSKLIQPADSRLDDLRSSLELERFERLSKIFSRYNQKGRGIIIEENFITMIREEDDSLKTRDEIWSHWNRIQANEDYHARTQLIPFLELFVDEKAEDESKDPRFTRGVGRTTSYGRTPSYVRFPSQSSVSTSSITNSSASPVLQIRSQFSNSNLSNLSYRELQNAVADHQIELIQLSERLKSSETQNSTFAVRIQRQKSDGIKKALEFEDLKKKLYDQQSTLGTLASQLEDSKENMEAHRSIITILHAEKQALLKRSDLIKDEAAEFRELVQRLQTRETGFRSRIKELTETLKTLQLQASETSLKKFSGDLSPNRLTFLENEIARLSALDADRKGMEFRIAELEAECLQARRTIMDLQSQTGSGIHRNAEDLLRQMEPTDTSKDSLHSLRNLLSQQSTCDIKELEQRDAELREARNTQAMEALRHEQELLELEKEKRIVEEQNAQLIRDKKTLLHQHQEDLRSLKASDLQARNALKAHQQTLSRYDSRGRFYRTIYRVLHFQMENELRSFDVLSRHLNVANSHGSRNAPSDDCHLPEPIGDATQMISFYSQF